MGRGWRGRLGAAAGGPEAPAAVPLSGEPGPVFGGSHNLYEADPIIEVVRGLAGHKCLSAPAAIRGHAGMVEAARELDATARAAQPMAATSDAPGAHEWLMNLLPPLNRRLSRLSAMTFDHTGKSATRDIPRLDALHPGFACVSVLISAATT